MKRIFTLSGISLIILLSACSRSDRDMDTTTNSSLDELMAQYISLDIFRMVDFSARNNKGFYATNNIDTLLYNCCNMQADTINKTILLNFNSGCTDTYGYKKSGKINISFSKKYDSLGCAITIGFDQYKINGYAVSGTIVYVVQSINNYGENFDYQPNIEISDSGKSMYWSANYMIKPKSGENTATTTDDDYLVSGSSNGRAFKGNEFVGDITGPLLLPANCSHITEGSTYLTPGNLSQRVVTYGSGTCDKSFIVSINGTKYNLTAF